MADPTNPHFHEQAVHEFLKYLDDRIEAKRAELDACREVHRVLLKTELAEVEVIRHAFEKLLGGGAG